MFAVNDHGGVFEVGPAAQKISNDIYLIQGRTYMRGVNLFDNELDALEWAAEKLRIQQFKTRNQLQRIRQRIQTCQEACHG